MRLLITVIAMWGMLSAARQARAEPIIALTALTNALLTFDSATPNTVTSPTAITGLQLGEFILAIDFRPATGQLAGLGSTGRIYTINSTTGAATEVKNLAPTSLSGTAFGFDFNPVTDGLRIVSDFDQNLRITAGGTGAVNVDGNLDYNVGDPNGSANPNVVGSAYTNNFAGATTTALYGIDSALDTLVRQGLGPISPNTGLLFTVGPLGVNTNDFVGFDISGLSGIAFAALTPLGSAVSNFYVINLAGPAILVGSIGGGQFIRDIAVSSAVVPEPGSLTLIGVGIAGWIGCRRRRRKRIS